MKRILVLAAVVLFCAAPSTRAEILFESGTLGPTGVHYSELGDTIPGTNVRPFAFTGVRFELTRPALTTEIGGHFVSPIDGTFFGVIVALDDDQDFPNSGSLSTSDVLGNTHLTFPTSSAEVYSPLELALDPGWYALVFGSGLFGTNGDGAAVGNNPDIGEPTYIGFQPLSGLPWLEISPAFKDHRFAVRGTIAPEPSTMLLAIVVLFLLLARRT